MSTLTIETEDQKERVIVGAAVAGNITAVAHNAIRLGLGQITAAEFAAELDELVQFERKYLITEETRQKMRDLVDPLSLRRA